MVVYGSDTSSRESDGGDKMIKAKVMWMNGGRVDGYYYVGIEGTDLRACIDGHPDFTFRSSEFNKDAKKAAQKCANTINKQLRNLK